MKIKYVKRFPFNYRSKFCDKLIIDNIIYIRIHYTYSFEVVDAAEFVD